MPAAHGPGYVLHHFEESTKKPLSPGVSAQVLSLLRCCLCSGVVSAGVSACCPGKTLKRISPPIYSSLLGWCSLSLCCHHISHSHPFRPVRPSEGGLAQSSTSYKWCHRFSVTLRVVSAKFKKKNSTKMIQANFIEILYNPFGCRSLTHVLLQHASAGLTFTLFSECHFWLHVAVKL